MPAGCLHFTSIVQSPMCIFGVCIIRRDTGVSSFYRITFSINNPIFKRNFSKSPVCYTLLLTPVPGRFHLYAHPAPGWTILRPKSPHLLAHHRRFLNLTDLLARHQYQTSGVTFNPIVQSSHKRNENYERGKASPCEGY